MRQCALFLLPLFLLTGCVTTFYQSDSEERAHKHMALADSFEVAGKWREAILEYKLVAELYSHTRFYPDAIRNTAWIHLHPLNPNFSDSAGTAMLAQYRRLPISPHDITQTEVLFSLLQRISNQQMEIRRRGVTSDSLLAVTKKQLSDSAVRIKRIADLEAEVARLDGELRRLCNVDLLIDKKRGK